MQQRMSAFAYRTLMHADWSLPAPMDGSTDDSTAVRSWSTGLQPSAELQYNMRRLQ